MLFFLDEMTALAAGHRPCGQCRKQAFNAFKSAWREAHGLADPPSVGALDGALAMDRGRLWDCPLASEMPAGTMVTVGVSGSAWALREGNWQCWTCNGYDEPAPLPPGEIKVVTPPSIVAVLRAGYVPMGF